MDTEDLQAYHQHITDIYDKRSLRHDRSEWHRTTSLKLVDDMPPREGESVLDIGSGTGTIAFRAASLVGPNGKVIGVDLSEGMLAQAKAKLAASGMQNLAFLPGDMEQLDFPADSFHKLYCASAFFCVLEPLKTLRHWYELLRQGGGLAFHAIPGTSYFWVSEARSVLENHGFNYDLNTPTATVEKTRRLLGDAGFSKIEIREEASGYYVPFENAMDSWLKPDDFTPGQYPHPVANVPADILMQCQKEYQERIEALRTDAGVWNDTTMYYVYAYK